ncbi:MULTISPECIES: LacI family DNA-binding transcriptional regulator [unclassified Streptomyces]|uniref:LacI family DNA-binding transcriptional regulator n=1 Tax=unclassified Streptomyces TaxID=2593676 RepID=UPI0006F371C6|nr:MULTISPECIES: LacI family DNA-binding transcriptional regulator [unclassified Streptomyces]KQX46137.1 LacI family transcriptional regulator [Streptomyces sp. Root1304]KRA80922.1 LacI family transcriptional regulator [Streptomyces sp. Root66D1]
MTARQVTIEDVARTAGVSRQTVSNALNAPHRLRDTTLARVTAAIEELGYQPDQSARSLRTGTRKVIGYPAPADNPADPNPLMGGFLQALITAADAVGHRILLFRCDPRQGAQAVARSFNGLIAARQIDGFVLSDVVHDDPRVDVLAEAGFPFAAFGRTAPGRPQTWVDIDSAAATADLVGRLVRQGHRRICYVNSAASLPWLADRRAGFLQAVVAAPDGGFEVSVPDDEPTALARAVQRLLAGPDRPTALVCAGDWLALTAYQAVRSAGLGVGSDIAVTGFNDLPLGTLLQPALTTVRLPLATIADALVDRLITAVENPAGTPAQGLLLPAETVVRASTPDIP